MNTSVFPWRLPLSQFPQMPYLYPNEARHMAFQIWQEGIDHMLQRWQSVECSSMDEMFNWMLMECHIDLREKLLKDGGWVYLYMVCAFMGWSPWRWWMWKRGGLERENETDIKRQKYLSKFAYVTYVWLYDRTHTSIFYFYVSYEIKIKIKTMKTAI